MNNLYNFYFIIIVINKFKMKTNKSYYKLKYITYFHLIFNFNFKLFKRTFNHFKLKYLAQITNYNNLNKITLFITIII